MKYSRSTVATVVAFCAAGSAHAQNSVTLYGVVDNSLGYVHNQTGSSNMFGMTGAELQGDRWGLKGEEDLGGGIKAIFKLENGFNVTNGQLGQGGLEFGRQAYVGLSSNRWGIVTVGRQYDPLVDLVQGFTEDNYFASVAGTPGDVDNYDNSLRTSNAVKYASPNYAGLQFEGLYAFSNLAGATGQGQTWSGAASYAHGPLGLAAGYFYASNPSAGRGVGASATWHSPSSDSLFDGPINSAYVSAHSIAIARAAVQYTVGPVSFGTSYSNAQYKPDGFSAFTETEKYNIGSVFADYQISPSLVVGGGYTYERATGDAGAKYHQIGLGLDYFASKRTDFYAIAAYQHALGTQATYTTNAAGVSVRTDQAAQASIGSFGYAGLSTQELVMLGIRHKF